MSSNTEVIVLTDYAPSMTKGLRRRKPWTREDQEVTQKHRQVLLDQIRCHRLQRNRLPSPVAFGRRKTLNRQFSKSVNDVKEVATVRSEIARVGSRKLALSQICLHERNDNFEVTFTKEGVRCSKVESLRDLSTAECCELQVKSQSETMTISPKIPEISQSLETNDVKEMKLKSPALVLGQQILNRQLSKSVCDVRNSGGGHFGLKVLGSQPIALSQIWTVPTNCGCCEHGQEGDCKRLKVKELRQKFSKEDVSPVKLEKLKTLEESKVEDGEKDATNPEIEADKSAEEKQDLKAVVTADDQDVNDTLFIVRMLSWVGRMIRKQPIEFEPHPDKWVELQVPVVPREGTAKDASSKSTKTSVLYLNVIVEVGSGLISITPVASFEEMIKTSVFVKEKSPVVQQTAVDYSVGSYFAFWNGPL